MSAIERKNFKLNFKIENKVFSGKKHKENRSGFCFGLKIREILLDGGGSVELGCVSKYLS